MSIKVNLLGNVSIGVEGSWNQLPPGKTSALLYYLVCQDKWVSRDALIYLFWPDTFEDNARNNLRRLLSSIRDLEYTQGIEIENSRLRWLVDSDIKTFREALAGGYLAKAVQLYRGELLAGFDLPTAPEFESWLELERQTLHKTWRDAVFDLAAEFEAKGQFAQAAEVLGRLHQAENFDESVLRHYLGNLWSAGQQQKALEVFEHFKKTLERELDAQPEKETLELVSVIRQGETKPLSVSRVVRMSKQTKLHNLPIQPTQFIGRENEKAKLAELLNEESCRLLSIVGPGGIGKTRLALEIAQKQLGVYPHGVWFVPFAAVTSPDLMAFAIGDALNLSFFGQEKPITQLLNYLQDKDMLLILDNLEHLVPDTQIIQEVLQHAPNVKLLTTSRERLNLQAERAYTLQGLGLSETNDDDAVRLFIQTAKNNGFETNETSLPHINHICHLVGGMPLAIELAASWLRVLPLEEIAKEIEKSIDFLQASTRDLPQRHQSIRAVFDYSWTLLSEKEQTILRRLSVFQGGFRREAAANIAGANLAMLANLVDKSFLNVIPNGRYGQHPLTYQYAQGKLFEQPQEKVQMEEKHGLYYLRLVQHPDELVEIWGDDWPEKAQERYRITKAEFANVRAAWQWAIRETNVDALKGPYFYYLGQLREKLELFSMVVKGLDETNPSHHNALGTALVSQGDCQSHLGFYLEARHSIEHGLNLLYKTNFVPGILLGLWALGFNARVTGEYEQSKEIYVKGLGMARQHGITRQIRVFLACVASIMKELEDEPNKEQFYEEALTELRQLDSEFCNFEHFLNYYAAFLLQNGNLEKAELLARESHGYAERNGNTFFMPFILNNLGMIVFKRGDYKQAQTLLQDALLKGEEENMPFFRALVLGNLGKVSIALGDYTVAKEYLKQSFEIGFQTKSSFNMTGSLVPLAELCVAQKQPKQAVQWLSLSLHHPATERHESVEAKRLLAELEKQMQSNEFSAALERGKTLDLTEVVQGILKTL